MRHDQILKEIPITEIDGLRIGNAQNDTAKTGVTVLLFDKKAKAGIDISGGGPASRETPLTSPLTADNPLNAIVLSGGSAYGLAASDGVMKYLEKRDIGYPTGFAKVPLVCQSCIYDLGLGKSDVRPDAAMGYSACLDAENQNLLSDRFQNKDAKEINLSFCGNIGAGCGASVGKLYGMDRSMKTGVGVCAVSLGELKLAAIVVLNAFGDIFNPDTGEKIAGLLNPDKTGFSDTCEELYQISKRTDLFTGNTTIGAIITNGQFSKAELGKIASMTRCAYSRCISPVATMADGDSIYAISMGNVPADINVTGTLAAEIMAEAILRAAKS